MQEYKSVMSVNRYKVIQGCSVRPDSLRSKRGKAIYKVAKSHPYVSDLQCFCSSQGDDILSMTLDSEIPDHPIYDIREKESIAIRCSKKDDSMPLVLALRPDFPLGLPHTNAVPYDHPVSLCISDVPYQDLRTSFNAFEFIELIRRWFALNAIGELHEKDRPLEVFFESSEFSYFPIYPDNTKHFRFVRYEKKTPLSSVIKETGEADANYCMVSIVSGINVSGYVRRLPKKLGDLRGLTDYYGNRFIDSMMTMISHRSLLKCTKPLMICVIVPLTRNTGGVIENINLFSIRINKATCDITHTARILENKHANAFLENLDITMSFLISEINVSWLRDCNGLKESFSEITLLGTGALGSQLLDHIVRKGAVNKINIVDNDALAPHNIARHTLDCSDLMKFKVNSLKEKYKGIKDLKVVAFAENFLNCKQNSLERIMSDSCLVIDASTSVGVERHLAIDMNQYPVRRATTFLNPKGSDVVLMIEDKGRKHRLDLLEMDYYRNIILQPDLSEHLSISPPVRTNHFSCRSESVIMSYDDVTALSSIVSAQLMKHIQSDESSLSLWKMNSDDGTIQSVNMTVTDWNVYYSGKITIYLSNAVLQEMTSLRNSKLQQPEPVETGGSYLGTYDRDRNIIYIVYMIPAPDDSVESGTSYIRGVKGLPEEVDRISQLTYWQVKYLGEWHSHPHGCSNALSATDTKLFSTMSTDLARCDNPFVIGILGDTGLNVKVSM